MDFSNPYFSGAHSPDWQAPKKARKKPEKKVEKKIKKKVDKKEK